MVNMSVQVGDVTLANPIMPASGTFSPELAAVIDLNRLGALVTKSITREFRAGNATPRVAETPSGMLNSIGIPSKGIDAFLNDIVPAYRKFSPALVASISAHSPDAFASLCHDVSVRDVDVISTGSLGLDVALGIGGLPRGRVVEVYGPESSGKTTLTLQVIAEAQRQGGTAAFVDAEHALDPIYAEKIGVDVDSMLVSQPDTGEQALEIADMLVRSGAVDVVVIDSVAALTPKAEIEGEMGDSHVGLQARLMSQALTS